MNTYFIAIFLILKFLLTTISGDDIMTISKTDITSKDIPSVEDKSLEVVFVGENTDKIALTEAVYYILISLYTPLHGYGIMQNIMKISDGRVNLAAGTLYGALTTLQEKGWIMALEDSDNSRKKMYEITDVGKVVVDAEIKRLEELLNNGHDVVRGRD